MSWQDDLGELDQALADGRISADAYRGRRDEILAAYSSGERSAPAAADPGDEPTTRAKGPFAPPFRWTSTSPDTTQVVPSGSDATQVVPRNSVPWPWPDEPDTLSPPDPTWLVQGPEVFQTGRPGRGRIAAIVAAVVVVVGLIVAGFVVFGQGGQVERGRATTRPSPVRPRPPDELAIAPLPGSAEDRGDVTTFEGAAGEDFLTPGEIGFYRGAGAGRSRLATSTTANGVHVLVFTTVAASPTAAGTARDDLAEQQLIYGMRQATAPPDGVRVAEVDRTATVPATIRAHYVHDATVVRIQVNGNDLTSVRAVFQDVIRAQVKALAPNG
ncbi:MAG TPA: hypothetical protein VHV49_13685 [Pseudonocardiaceae bacterium]|jgi:hypothetical protein|nr:hypothetical protein [Pseudonocardiaceae bacterium]